MTSACSCLSEDLMIWVDAMKKKKRCPKVMKIKVFIFIVRKKKKKAEPFISLSWRIKLTDLQRTG